MPLRDFTCDACGKSQERFFQQTKLTETIEQRQVIVKEQTAPTYPPCEDCGGTLTVLPLSQPSRRFVGAVFPFVNKHIDPKGRPIVIESMGHLRAVEKQYGVVLPAFSKGNARDLDPIKDPPRYRGLDPDFERSRH